jgi:Flp pilus assembly pilin Flp
MEQIKKLLQDKRGANMTEYIILLALIAIIVMAAVQTFGDKVKGRFDDKQQHIANI